MRNQTLVSAPPSESPLADSSRPVLSLREPVRGWPGGCEPGGPLPGHPSRGWGCPTDGTHSSLSPESPCEAVCSPCRGSSESVIVFPGDLPAEPSKMTASASHPDLLGAWDAWAEAPAPTLAADG